MPGNTSNWQVFLMELGHALSPEEIRVNSLGKKAKNKLNEDKICVCR